MSNKTLEDMSVVDHLHELRKRLIIILVMVLCASGIIYSKVYYVTEILMSPIKDLNLELVYFSLTEGLMTRMEISMFLGTFAVSPVILKQILSFINPALTEKEKKLMYKSLFWIILLFITGFIFGYKLILPYVLKILITFGQGYLKSLLSGIIYFNFIGVFCFFIGIVFLIPYVIVLLGRMGLLSSGRLRKWRKYVIIFTLTFTGLLISSAGFITCLLAAAPLLILYEASIWIICFKEKRKKKKEKNRRLKS